jgi:hypothetical protein
MLPSWARLRDKKPDSLLKFLRITYRNLKILSISDDKLSLNYKRSKGLINREPAIKSLTLLFQRLITS